MSFDPNDHYDHKEQVNYRALGTVARFLGVPTMDVGFWGGWLCATHSEAARQRQWDRAGCSVNLSLDQDMYARYVATHAANPRNPSCGPGC